MSNLRSSFMESPIPQIQSCTNFSISPRYTQYCLKSEKAFEALAEDMQSLEVADYRTFHEQFNLWDQAARRAMKELIDSEKNKVTEVFSTLL